MGLSIMDRALELANAATEGPWEVHNGDGIRSNDGNNDIIGYSIPWEQSGVNDTNDAAFIAASRTLMPELARRLKKACEALREVSDEYQWADTLADELEAPLEEKK